MPGGGAAGIAAPNTALNLINQLLTTPRQPPSGLGTGGPTGGGGGAGIAGIASKHDGAAVKVYKERKKFKEWEFVFDPNENAPKAPVPGNPLGGGSGSQPGILPLGGTPPAPSPPAGAAPSIGP